MPSFYYKVKAYKNGKETKLSEAAEGNAAALKDIVEIKNFTAVLDTSKGRAVDGKFYYCVELSWDPVDDARYMLYSVSSTGETTTLLEGTDTTLRTNSGAFNTTTTYYVYPIITNKGNVQGRTSQEKIVRTIPSPVTNLTATTLAMIDTTNEIICAYGGVGEEIFAHARFTYQAYVLFSGYKDRTGNYAETGSIKKAWSIEREAGFIALRWDRYEGEDVVDYFLIERKGEGDSDDKFERVAVTSGTAYTNWDYTIPDEVHLPSVKWDSSANSYPKYEYRVTAVYGTITSEMNNQRAVGSAADSDDIAPPTAYAVVPAHVATGLGTTRNAKWEAHADSHPDISLVNGENFTYDDRELYLTWAHVDNADYMVRYMPMMDDEWSTKLSSTSTNAVAFDNVNETGLYIPGITADGITGHVPRSVSFDVTSINPNRGNLPGGVYSVFFQEATDPY